MAQLAGVSPKTISNYLNKSAPVKIETGEKIREAIKELGYAPNKIARKLRSGMSRFITFMTSDFWHSSLDCEHGIEKRLIESGYSLIISSLDEHLTGDFDSKKVINDIVFDGVIFDIGPKEFVEDIIKTNAPVVITSEYNLKGDYNLVTINNYKGGRLAAQHLIDNKHKKIGLISIESSNIETYENRKKGFLEVLKENNLELIFEIDIPFGREDSIKDSFIINQNILLKKDITAIFVLLDIYAIYLIDFFNSKGINIPDDISIISFDNSRYSEIVKPKLTTVNHFFYKLGYIAADNLINNLENSQYRKEKIFLEPEIVIRDSVKKL